MTWEAPTRHTLACRTKGNLHLHAVESCSEKWQLLLLLGMLTWLAVAVLCYASWFAKAFGITQNGTRSKVLPSNPIVSCLNWIWIFTISSHHYYRYCSKNENHTEVHQTAELGKIYLLQTIQGKPCSKNKVCLSLCKYHCIYVQEKKKIWAWFLCNGLLYIGMTVLGCTTTTETPGAS